MNVVASADSCCRISSLWKLGWWEGSVSRVGCQGHVATNYRLALSVQTNLYCSVLYVDSWKSSVKKSCNEVSTFHITMVLWLTLCVDLMHSPMRKMWWQVVYSIVVRYQHAHPQRLVSSAFISLSTAQFKALSYLCFITHGLNPFLYSNNVCLIFFACYIFKCPLVSLVEAQFWGSLISHGASSWITAEQYRGSQGVRVP